MGDEGVRADSNQPTGRAETDFDTLFERIAGVTDEFGTASLAP